MAVAPNRALHRCRRPRGDAAHFAVVFALSQWENWLWGPQFIFYLTTLAAVAGLLLLANSSWQWGRLSAPQRWRCGDFSFGMGAIWPVGLIRLLWLPRHGRANATWVVAAWAVVGAAALLACTPGFQASRFGTQSENAVQQPIHLPPLGFNYLGSPVLAHDSAFVAGGLGVVAWLGALVFCRVATWPSSRLHLMWRWARMCSRRFDRRGLASARVRAVTGAFLTRTSRSVSVLGESGGLASILRAREAGRPLAACNATAALVALTLARYGVFAPGCTTRYTCAISR